MTLDVSVQILPFGSCKLENSFLHGWFDFVNN